MRLAAILAIIAAALVHGAFLLFGGLLVGDASGSPGTARVVELLAADDAPDDEKPPEPEPQDTEELEREAEEPPDSSELLQALEPPPSSDAPALEAASLAAIEAALEGSPGAGGDFASALSFASGGRIGGTGTGSAMEEKIEQAFSLAEIDQKPRAVFQTTPSYPAELRRRRVEGVVSIIFIVDAAGKVSQARVETSTHAAFERPAVADA
jgi:outer membrane biosynthesis protein TonB